MASTFNPEGFGIAKVLWSLTGDPEQMITTFGFQDTPGLSPFLTASALDTIFNDNFVPGSLHSSFTYLGVEVQMGNEAGTGGPVGYSPEAIPGTAGGSGPLPQNCALMINKRTAVGGRIGRGRCYFPSGYLLDSAVSGTGVIDPTLVTSLTVISQAFRNDLEAATYQMVLLHVQDLPILPPFPVDLFVVDPIIATQRTRLRR